MIEPPRPATEAAALAVRVASERDARLAARIFRSAKSPVSERVEAALDEAKSRLRRDPRGAYRLARFSLGAARGAGLGALWSRAARTAGGAAMALGRPRLALAHYDHTRRAPSPLDPVADAHEIAAFEVKRIHPLALLGRHDEARRAAETALAISAPHGDQVAMAEIEIALGDLEFRRDRFRDALRQYSRARDRLAPDRHARLRAILDINSANCLEALQRHGAANRLFRRARATFERDGLRQAVAQVDHNLGYFAFVRGRYADALRLFDSAEATLTELGDVREVAQIALERAELHLRMGMPRDARRQAGLAAECFERAGLAKERAQALVFGAVAEMVEHGPRSDETLAAARATFLSLGSDVWAAECDLLRATAAEASGDGAAAERLATEAARVFGEARLVARVTAADILLARLEVSAGRPAAALARIDRADSRLDGLAGPWLAVELLRARGLAEIASGRFELGAASLEAAVAALESHRGAVPPDEFMAAFLATHVSLFAETVAAQLRVGRDEDAFDTCERARARALADRLAARAVTPEAPRDLADVRLTRQREELNALYARLHGHAAPLDEIPPARVRELRAETARRESELADTLRRRAAGRVGDHASPLAEPLPLERIQAALDGDTTLVEYFAAPDGLHAFVVRRATFAHRRLAVDDAWIGQRVERLRFHLAKFDVAPATAGDDLGLRATRSNLAELAAAVLQPVRDLVTTTRLVVVPHPALHGVPFHAFPDGDGWVADTLDVAYAPSAAVYVRCGARQTTCRGRPSILALADESAPMIANEAIAVARALGPDAKTFAGPEATVDRLREAVRTSRIVHLATHGMFREEEPGMSCVRLADGWLNFYDACELDVRSELVVVSACESGAPATSAGGDPSGVLGGLLVGGAARVVASQWRVSDAATALFMTSFYSALGRRAGPEAAVRAAREAVRRRLPHPYHWAAFFLFGHPGGAPEGRQQELRGAPERAAAHEPGRVACAPGS